MAHTGDAQTAMRMWEVRVARHMPAAPDQLMTATKRGLLV